jgi:phosphoserine/homoserine phosphotransferase
MDKLENPFLLCHNLETDSTGRIVNYHLRQSDPKRKTVQAFKSLMYNVVAFGDSYNDVTMIAEADKGILFCPPDNVKADFPQYPVVNDLASLKQQLLSIVKQ